MTPSVRVEVRFGRFSAHAKSVAIVPRIRPAKTWQNSEDHTGLFVRSDSLGFLGLVQMAGKPFSTRLRRGPFVRALDRH